MHISIQIIVIILSLTARYLVGSRNSRTVKAGCCIGLFDEFAWIGMFLLFRQEWMIILSVAYMFMWIRMYRSRL